MALVDFQVEGCALRLHHVYQGEYMAINEINIDRAEQNICHNCVDKLQMRGKPEK